MVMRRNKKKKLMTMTVVEIFHMNRMVIETMKYLRGYITSELSRRHQLSYKFMIWFCTNSILNKYE